MERTRISRPKSKGGPSGGTDRRANSWRACDRSPDGPAGGSHAGTLAVCPATVPVFPAPPDAPASLATSRHSLDIFLRRLFAHTLKMSIRV